MAPSVSSNRLIKSPNRAFPLPAAPLRAVAIREMINPDTGMNTKANSVNSQLMANKVTNESTAQIFSKMCTKPHASQDFSKLCESVVFQQ